MRPGRWSARAPGGRCSSSSPGPSRRTRAGRRGRFCFCFASFRTPFSCTHSVWTAPASVITTARTFTPEPFAAVASTSTRIGSSVAWWYVRGVASVVVRAEPVGTIVFRVVRKIWSRGSSSRKRIGTCVQRSVAVEAQAAEDLEESGGRPAGMDVDDVRTLAAEDPRRAADGLDVEGVVFRRRRPPRARSRAGAPCPSCRWSAARSRCRRR